VIFKWTYSIIPIEEKVRVYWGKTDSQKTWPIWFCVSL